MYPSKYEGNSPDMIGSGSRAGFTVFESVRQPPVSGEKDVDHTVYRGEIFIGAEGSAVLGIDCDEVKDGDAGVDAGDAKQVVLLDFYRDRRTGCR